MVMVSGTVKLSLTVSLMVSLKVSLSVSLLAISRVFERKRYEAFWWG